MNENSFNGILNEIEKLTKNPAFHPQTLKRKFSSETPGFWEFEEGTNSWDKDGKLNTIKITFERSLNEDSDAKKEYQHRLDSKNQELYKYKSALKTLQKDFYKTKKSFKIERKKLLREKSQLKKMIDSLEEKALRTNSSLLHSSSDSEVEGHSIEEKINKHESSVDSSDTKKRQKTMDFDQAELKDQFEYSPGYLKKEGFYINISPSKDSKAVTEEHRIKIQGASDYLGRKSRDYAEKFEGSFKKINSNKRRRINKNSNQNFQSLQEEVNLNETRNRNRQRSLSEEDHDDVEEKEMISNSPGFKLTNKVNEHNFSSSNLEVPRSEKRLLKLTKCGNEAYMIPNGYGISSGNKSRLKNLLNHSLNVNPKNVIEEEGWEGHFEPQNYSDMHHNMSNPLYSNRTLDTKKSFGFKKIMKKRKSIFTKKLSNTNLWLKTAKELELKKKKQTLRRYKNHSYGNGGLGLRTNRTMDFDKKLSYTIFDTKKCSKKNDNVRHLYCDACNEGFENLEKNLDLLRKKKNSGFISQKRSLKSENEYFDSNSVHHPMYMTGEF